MKVSICIAVYNSENTIRQTLTSIQNQTHQDFEVIIVDDHSTDNTANIVMNEFCIRDDRFKLYVNCTVEKYQDAHNLSYEYATGEILFRVDGDDILMPDYLEYHINFFNEHPDIDAFSTSMIRMKYENEICVPLTAEEDAFWLESQTEEERNYFNEHPEISWCGNTMIWSNPSSSLRKTFYDKYHPKFISYGFGDYIFWWDVISWGAKLYKSNVAKSYHCDRTDSVAKDKNFYFIPWTLSVQLCDIKIRAFKYYGYTDLIEKTLIEKEDYLKKLNG